MRTLKRKSDKREYSLGAGPGRFRESIFDLRNTTTAKPLQFTAEARVRKGNAGNGEFVNDKKYAFELKELA
jgi:hypothetical protein